MSDKELLIRMLLFIESFDGKHTSQQSIDDADLLVPEIHKRLDQLND